MMDSNYDSAMLKTYELALNKHAIISKTDPQGKITFVNENFCRLSGYSTEEVLGQDHRILNSGYHSKDFFKNLWTTVNSKLVWQGEIKNKAKDGTFFWVDTTIAPVIGQSGDIQEIITLRHDITERKEAVPRLLESENKYRVLFAQSFDAVMTLNPPNWKFTSANQATLKLFGAKSEEEFCQLEPWDVSPEFQENGKSSAVIAKKMIQDAMENGSSFFDWTHTKLDGTKMSCTVLLSRMEFQGQTYLQATVRDVSKEKELYQQLIEAEAISKIGSWSYNFLTGKQIWSPEHYKIFEIPSPQRPEELYRLYRERIHPEDLKTLDRIMQRAEFYGEDFVYEHRVILDGGVRVKHVQGIGKVTRDESGKTIFMSGTCRDRTKDVEAEEKFRLLINSMSEGLVVQDKKGKVFDYNPAALKILELSEDQLSTFDPNDPPWKLIKQDGTPLLPHEHPVTLSLKGGKNTVNRILGLQFINNETKWLKINSIPLETYSGRIVLTTFTEITELVKTVEENAFVLDTLGLGVWKYNLKNNELKWDQSMYRLYGIRPEDFSGDYDAWEKSLSKKDRVQAVEELQLALAGEKEFNTCFEVQLQNAEKKMIGARGRVIRDHNGTPIMMYGINWDETKEYELKKKLELEEAKSLHMSKLASIGVIAAGVGHEINNPLAIISGQLLLIKGYLESRGLLDSTITERLLKSEKSIERISKIVQGLRTFARTDGTDFTHFNFHDLAVETIGLVKEIFSKDGIEFVVEVEQELWVFGNRGRVQQVIVNLLNNARDALESVKDKEIRIQGYRKKDELQFSIQDNGCGIPNEIREKIFEPFFTTKEVNKGTGMGLALIHSIIKEHKGEINVESSRGHGSTFTLTIPCSQISTTHELKIPKAKTPLKQFSGTILIVDDEEDLRDILKSMIKNHGPEVLCASNGQEALQILRENSHHISLIISDIKMPILDGPSLLKKIRSELEYRGDFFFITGGVTSEVEAFRGDVQGILTKPVRTEDLAEILSIHFDN